MKARMTLLAGWLALIMGGSLLAADTTITIPGLECDGCAKKIANALKPVAGVADVQTDVEAHKAVVKSKPGVALSAKALWEALEKIKKDPTKLEGPSGTFTARPPS